MARFIVRVLYHIAEADKRYIADNQRDAFVQYAMP